MGYSATARDWREGRRIRAWELNQQGWKQVDIACALGVTAGAVSQWLKRAREGGVQALRQIPGRLLVIWDGSPIHRGRAVKDFLDRGAAKRLRLEPLPAYAPELNPDEGIWNLLKRVELRHVRCQDPAHLEDELRRAVTRLRRKRPVLRACLRQVGYAI